MKKLIILSVISLSVVLMLAVNVSFAAISVSVDIASAPADTATGFTFETQAATPGGSVQFDLFHDVNNNGIIDVGEWSLAGEVLVDNGPGYNWGFEPDSNPSSPEITTVLSVSKCNSINYFPVGYFIVRVKNALGETGIARFRITPAFASQEVTGYVYEEGTTIPVSNALVEYDSEGVESLSFTDSNGHYVLQIPEAGSGEVCVEKDGYGEHCLGLAVPAGGVSNYDLYLTPTDTQITGTVVDATNNPVWGAEVWAEIPNIWNNETWTYTNIDGSFTLPVMLGSIEIGTDKYGFMGTESNLAVPAGGVENHNISLTPATTQIEGIVTEFGTSNTICGAEVWVETSNGESWNDTAADGSFTLPVTPGEATICIEQDGYMTSCSTITVPVGGISNFSASLVPMDAQITGTVKEFGTGNPISGININANTTDSSVWIDTVSDHDGNFTLPVLSGIEWRVSTFGNDGYIGEDNVFLIPTVVGPNTADFILHLETAWIEGTLLDEYGTKAIEGAFFWFYRTNPAPPLWNFGITDSSGHVTVGGEAGDWYDGVSPENTSELLVDGLPREMVRQDGQVISNITTSEHRAVTRYMYYADGAIEGRVYYRDGVTPVPNASISVWTSDALNGPGQTSVGWLSEHANSDMNGFYRIPLLGGIWVLDVNFGAATDTRTLITDGNDIIDQPGETLTGVDLILNYNIHNDDDVIVDFGASHGIWRFMNNSTWLRLHTLSPEFIATGDIDGSGQDDVIMDFGPAHGIWRFMNNSTWSRLHTLSSEGIATGDMDGNGKDDVIIDFGSLHGIWVRYDDGSWKKLHSLSPEDMTTGDIDGSGQDDVIIDFGSDHGVWRFMNNSTWLRLHTLSPEFIATGDIDGSGQDDVIIDFGSDHGVWKFMNNSTWVRLHTLSPELIATGDIDGSGQDDVIIDFGPDHGVWKFMNNSTWVRLHTLSPELIATGDIDGSGQDDMIIDFGSVHGVWRVMNNSTWVKLHTLSPEIIATGDIDGN